MKGLLSNLGVRTPLSKVRWYFVLNVYTKLYIKINEIVNNFLLADDKIMPEVHLKQPGFTYSACGTYKKQRKNKEFKNLKKQGVEAIFTKMNLIKHAFNYGMAYGDFKDLKRKTASEEILRDKAFNIAKNPTYDGC